MKVIKNLRWLGIALLTLLYIAFKTLGIGGSIINIFSIGLAGIILTLPLEEKVYAAFFFMQGYLYIYIFSFAFYNVITLLILGHMLIKKQNFPKLNVIFLTVLVFVYEIISYVIYDNMQLSYFIKWIIAFLVSFSLMNNKHLKFDKCRAIFLYALGSTFVEVGTLLINSTIIVGPTLGDRFSGGLTTLNNNTFSLYCILCVSLCIYVFCDRKIKETSLFYQKYKKIVSISLIGFAGIAFITGATMVSKAYFLVTILWIVLLILFNAKYKKRTIFLVSCVAIALIVVLNVPATRELIDHVIARFGNLDDLNEITTGRTEILVQYVTKLISSPLNLLFGAGLFTYPTVLNIDISLQGTPMITHNIILEIICAYGLVGFSILLLAYLRVFRKNCSYKNYKDLNRFLPLIVFLIFVQSLALFREDVTHYIILLCFIVCKNDANDVKSNQENAESAFDNVNVITQVTNYSNDDSIELTIEQ